MCLKRVVIGQVALVQESKRQDIVIEIAAELNKREIAVKVVFVGGVREREYASSLKSLAASRGLAADVVFAGRREDVENWLKVMDVLVIPSSFEGFPLAGLEAAAADVPVLALDEGGASEFVNVCGGRTFSRSDSYSSMADVLCSLLADRDDVTRRGFAFASKQNEDVYGSKIGAVFSDALMRRSWAR